MSTNLTLKAKGLITSNNQLEVPEGALSEARNIVIKQDGVIEPCRGFNLYGDAFPSLSDRAKQLTQYRKRVIRHYDDKLEFDSDDAGDFQAFSGSYEEAASGYRLKSIESNGNYYFATSNGIKKISAKTASQFTTDSGFINDAGIPKAVSFTSEYIYEYAKKNGILAQDSAVAYRTLWGYRDANNNLILGAPSERSTVYLSLKDLLLQDFLVLLSNIDNTALLESMINDANYVDTLKLTFTASASQLRTNLISLCEKLDTELLYADNDGVLSSTVPFEIVSAAIATGNIVTITFDNTTGSGARVSQFFSTGQKIKLDGLYQDTGLVDLQTDQIITALDDTNNTITFVNSGTIANGAVTIDATSAIESNTFRSITQPSVPATIATNNNLVDLQTYLSAIITALQLLPNDVLIANDTGTGVALNIDSAACSVVANVATITFSAGDPRLYTIAGNKIAISGFTRGTSIDGTYTVASVTATTLTFPVVVADGAIVVAATATIDKATVFSERTVTTYLDILDTTTSADVSITIDIPEEVDSRMFFQVYRSSPSVAEGASTLQDLIPNDELKLVYEAFPTSAELAALSVTFIDVQPDDFAGTNLYTNAATGEGILQANDIPPFAKDLNKFKGYTLYANTKTRHKKSISLLGVQNIIDLYDLGTTSKLTIGDITESNTFSFIKGVRESYAFTTTSGAALDGEFLTLYTPSGKQFRVVYDATGTTTIPAVADVTDIYVRINTGDTDVQIATKTEDKLSVQNRYFEVTSSGNTLTVLQIAYGNATNPLVNSTGFILVTTEGSGENITNKQVLLSDNISPAIAVEETAKSLVRVINGQTTSPIYAYYVSGELDVPGQMIFEKRELDGDPFYLIASNATLGASFNPDLTFSNTITAISLANPTLVTTATAHGLEQGALVAITDSDSTPSIDGVYAITYVSTTTFTIPVNVTVAGTSAKYSTVATAEASENEEKVNRLYYSKFQQPEAVPVLNYIDIGDEDKEILRIYPLRDSLFIFKEDGLFRLSGESAPFSLAVFDSTCILVAPDSIGSVENLVFAYTREGVSAVSESGISVISRSIDNLILKLSSSEYTNFKTATWGIGYQSDSSYLLYTLQKKTDTLAMTCYRYNTITSTWTTRDKSSTCGVVSLNTDVLFLGAGDINYIERERKKFDRTDFADREFVDTISANKLNGNIIKLPTVTNYAIGDAVTQDQYVTVYGFNQLLKMLDSDPVVADSNYYSTLVVAAGANIRTSTLNLATKLDADTGVNTTSYLTDIANKSGTATIISAAAQTIITSASHGLITGRIVRITASNSTPVIDGNYSVTVLSANTFRINKAVVIPGTTATWETLNTDLIDQQTCYNSIINKLNTDSGVFFSNYTLADTLELQESVITNVNAITKEITLSNTLEYYIGNITIFKAIEASFLYSPNPLGNPVFQKQVRDATLMYESRAFSGGKFKFASDVRPMIQEVPFSLSGQGLFGFTSFGEGLFGGVGAGVPMRTYVPSECQRCTYIIAGFSHKVAREDYRIYGMSLTFETISERAFR